MLNWYTKVISQAEAVNFSNAIVLYTKMFDEDQPTFINVRDTT